MHLANLSHNLPLIGCRKLCLLKSGLRICEVKMHHSSQEVMVRGGGNMFENKGIVQEREERAQKKDKKR